MFFVERWQIVGWPRSYVPQIALSDVQYWGQITIIPFSVI